MAVDPRDIPQADSLTQVRRVVSALARKTGSVGTLPVVMGISARHVQYAIHAARMLGLLQGTDEGPMVTTISDALLATPEGEEEERRFFRELIAKNSTIAQIAPGLGSDRPPSRLRIVNNILNKTSLSPTTALRRATALLAWHRQVAGTPKIATSRQAAPKKPKPKKPKLPQLTLNIPEPELRTPLTYDLFRDNPWWRDEPGKALPPTRRAFVDSIHRRLKNRLAPVVVVRGPRQVGKTTAQLQVINDLLASGIDSRCILRVQFDELPEINQLQEPILRIVDWYERAILKCSLNAAAHKNIPTFLFFDEVQNLPDWAIQLKHLVDTSTTQIVVTGSSALRIEAGRDSLAGRITTIEVGTLTLSEVSMIRGAGTLTPFLLDNGVDSFIRKEFWYELREHGKRQALLRDQAMLAFSERGGYPLVHERASISWNEIAAQLNETVIQRVIRHDLRIGERGRKRDEALLEELFRLCCRYAGQSPGVELLAREIHRALNANVGAQKVRSYLDFLDRTLLLRLVRPLEIRLKKTRGAPKLCLADHGLRASWLHEVIPISPDGLASQPELSDLAGRLVESIVGSYLMTIGGVALTHFPERPGEPEVDFVLTVGTQRIPIEVKYRRRIDTQADTEGLRSFIEKVVYRAPFGILITQDENTVVDDPRIIVLSLSNLLLLR